MKNKKIVGLGIFLFIFSMGAKAGVPNFGYSHDYDIGTLGSTQYATSFSVENNLLDHSYTFDLAAPATVDAWLFNPRIETGDIYTGIPPLTITLFDLSIFDSTNHELYKGTRPDSYSFGSTMRAHVAGVLPAGDNYFVRVTGSQINDSALAYQLHLIALPVPEPETWGMFLAGLGLLGWRMRRSISR